MYNRLLIRSSKTKPSKHTKRFKQMYGELKTKNEKEPENRGKNLILIIYQSLMI